jgi:hypothetical protein
VSPDLPPPRDPEAAEFLAWLRDQDADELRAFRSELEAFAEDAEDETRYAQFARAALPVVRAVIAELEGKELVRPAFEQVFGDSMDFDRAWEALGALNRASKQLGTDASPVELFLAAFEAAGYDPAKLPAPEEDP